MKEIVIMGAGELGKEVVWLIEDINRKKPTWVILGFLDDTKIEGDLYCGYPILGPMNRLEQLRETNSFYAVIAVQNGADKAMIAANHEDFKRWATIIHPTAVIAPESCIGDGSIVFPQVTVSVDTVIGKHVLLYIHSIICNDCKIEDYASVMSGVSVAEHVTIGERSYLSAGCDVYPHIKIGDGCRIAVGSNIDKDITNNTETDRKNKGFFHK